jgi:hypothetical protein
MSYIDIYAAATATDSALRKQIAVACSKAALDIFNEASDTANHANRLGWARRVQLTGIGGPAAMADTMIWKVLENATIQANPAAATDSDIQFVVNSILETFANGI